jgi:DNA-binding response OmpR family regulator
MKAHILAVDDDKRIAQTWRQALAYEGYSVDVAHTGAEALSRALERPPDLYILDLGLPGMSGLEICKRLRESGDQTPILMITARDEVARGSARWGTRGSARRASPGWTWAPMTIW